MNYAETLARAYQNGALHSRKHFPLSGVLSSSDILAAYEAGEIRIDGFEAGVEAGRLQGASYDLALGDTFFRRRLGLSSASKPLDLTNPPIEEMFARHEGDILLAPGEMVIGHTRERAGTLSPALNAELATTSSAARFGIDTHAGAGWGDPVFADRWALEIYNRSPDWVILQPGMILCQIVFMRLITPTELKYGIDVGQYALAADEKFDAARLLPRRIKRPAPTQRLRILPPVDAEVPA